MFSWFLWPDSSSSSVKSNDDASCVNNMICSSYLCGCQEQITVRSVMIARSIASSANVTKDVIESIVVFYQEVES